MKSLTHNLIQSKMYIVEGNIGVGKSTFLKEIADQIPELETIQEPVETWNNQAYGQSLLSEFYNDTPRWAYTLETLALICRVREHVKESKNKYPYRLMERSIYSGHYCFAQNDFANKYLTKMEWSLYQDWVDYMIKQQCSPPLGFIYLKADPKVCFERTRLRGRESEKNLTLEYIEQIHFWHERFLVEKRDIFDSIKYTPVLILDCNENFYEDQRLLESHINSVRMFLGVKNSEIVENALTY